MPPGSGSYCTYTVSTMIVYSASPDLGARGRDQRDRSGPPTGQQQQPGITYFFSFHLSGQMQIILHFRSLNVSVTCQFCTLLSHFLTAYHLVTVVDSS